MLRVKTVAVGFLVFCTGSVTRAQGSWKELEAALQTAAPYERGIDLHEIIAKVPLAREVYKSQNDLVWKKAVSEKGHPMVALFGLLCILEQGTDSERWEYSVKLLLNAEETIATAFYDPAVAHITTQWSFEKVDKALCCFPGRRYGLRMLLLTIRTELLEEWLKRGIEERFAGCLDVDRIAMVIDRVLTTLEEPKTPKLNSLRPQFRRLYSQFEAVPGYPRYVYTLHSSPDQEIVVTFKQRMLEVLNDLELTHDEKVVLILSRRQFIRTNLQFFHDRLSNEVVELIDIVKE